MVGQGVLTGHSSLSPLPPVGANRLREPEPKKRFRPFGWLSLTQFTISNIDDSVITTQLRILELPDCIGKDFRGIKHGKKTPYLFHVPSQYSLSVPKRFRGDDDGMATNVCEVNKSETKRLGQSPAFSSLRATRPRSAFGSLTSTDQNQEWRNIAFM
jgi:hypothetical protein